MNTENNNSLANTPASEMTYYQSLVAGIAQGLAANPYWNSADPEVLAQEAIKRADGQIKALEETKYPEPGSAAHWEKFKKLALEKQRQELEELRLVPKHAIINYFWEETCWAPKGEAEYHFREWGQSFACRAENLADGDVPAKNQLIDDAYRYVLAYNGYPPFSEKIQSYLKRAKKLYAQDHSVERGDLLLDMDGDPMFDSDGIPLPLIHNGHGYRIDRPATSKDIINIMNAPRDIFLSSWCRFDPGFDDEILVLDLADGFYLFKHCKLTQFFP